VAAYPAQEFPLDATSLDIRAKFATLKAAAMAEPYPSVAVRRDRLGRAIDSLLRHERSIVDALDADFGGRPEALSLLTDVMAPIRSLRHAKRHVNRWMRTERRIAEFPMGLIGGRASVFHQPLGVVGIVAPWNAPVALAYSPLASALAAGNRAFIKPSELVPAVSKLISEMVKGTFAESEVSTAQGGVEVAREFTSMPFDHLIYTGSAATARMVMKAASEHLVPVTLELGGKSPAIVARGANLAFAAAKIASGKLANAGQVCMAPDFVLVHRTDQAEFIDAIVSAVGLLYPNLPQNTDYTRVHLPRQRQRLAGMVHEVVRRGVDVRVLTGVDVSEIGNTERFPPVIIVDPPLDTALMREEIFGPLLPILTYDSLEEAVRLLSSMSRPLALYLLGGSAADKDYVLRTTYAGGVTFDDVMLHPFMQDLPFGGVGDSGMGCYLGFDGFKALSNSKGVVQRPWIDVSRFIAPPYTAGLTRAMRRIIRY
jgi:coniferyl-aldehyde dehydrogenase